MFKGAYTQNNSMVKTTFSVNAYIILLYFTHNIRFSHV